MTTTQPRKQRKTLYNLPLHKRRKQITVTLSKALRTQHKRRNIPLRKGDKVKIVKGKWNKDEKGKRKLIEGKVIRIDYSRYKVFLEGIMLKKKNGKEVAVGISPASLVITELDLADKKRMKVK